MDFYTNVNKYGSYIYISGYENGIKKLDKEKFQPTLYYKPQEKNTTTPFQTIFNEPLKSIQFDSIPDASSYVKQRDGTNVEVYGNTNYIYQWIAENFPDEIRGIDSTQINICIYDLEMESRYGFPEPDEASQPILSGSFYFSKTNTYHVFGLKPNYVPHLDNVEYTYCPTEIDLLSKIIQLFANESPDLLTGWNIRLFDTP